MTATVVARPTIESKEIKFLEDGSTIIVKAKNAERPRRLEHTLERCSLAPKSYGVNCITEEGVLSVTVTVHYDDVKRTGDVRENAKKVSALNDAMTRVIEALR